MLTLSIIQVTCFLDFITKKHNYKKKTKDKNFNLWKKSYE